MLIDSNLIIYATQPPYMQLRSWLVNYATHYSAISRLETLGYHRLGEAEKQAIMAILDNLDVLMINKVTHPLQIAQQQARIAQELAIARRIENADEVEIEEFYDTSGTGNIGATVDAKSQTGSLGIGASGRQVTKRVYHFKGWRSNDEVIYTQTLEQFSSTINRTIL